MSQTTTQLDDSAAVDPNLPPDPSRRFWVASACAVGGVAVVATAVPFVGSFAPSDKARAAGAPVEVDVSNIAPGHMITVAWRGIDRKSTRLHSRYLCSIRIPSSS